MRIIAGSLLLVVLSLLAGCTSARLNAYQERVIVGAAPDDVMQKAARMLQREFGRIQVDARAQRISTAPFEYTTERESGTARDLYRGRSTMRRTASFELGTRQEHPIARLRIEVERRDTERQAVMQPRGYRLTDAPGHETPIYADAATTEAQNVVWTFVRRDTRLERALLEELRELFKRETEAAEPTRSPAPAED